jgi:fluoroquinolone transport system permease protein
MSAFATALRWDVVVQSRNGFYSATAFVVLVVGGLLLAVPEAARADEAAWVPALVAVNLQITTFFFVAGLLLLERDEGTLIALAVSPLTPAAYLATRTLSLTTLAGIETLALVSIAFADSPSWPLLLAGTSALGVIYTGIGACLATRYASVNALLLPASVIVTLLLVPLLPHLGLAPRALVLVHPIEPALTLMRAAYGETDVANIAFGILGSCLWGAMTFFWGQRRVGRLMQDTVATGGR